MAEYSAQTKDKRKNTAEKNASGNQKKNSVKRNYQKKTTDKKTKEVKSEQKNQSRKNTSAPKKTSQKNISRKPASRSNAKKALPLRIIPLGGLDEIGKNITLYEYGSDMFLVDCGMAFPDEDTPGIDIVIPDFEYIVANKDKIRGLVITHGHEDHIGAVPYLLKNLNIPIYGTRLTIGLIEGKLREHKMLAEADLHTVDAGTTIKLGAFSVEFIHVNHSIPDAVALAIRCPAGLVVQTGDFKIDTTPIDDKVIDLARFGELGREGVLALLSDSTNAERAGFTASEKLVGESFSNLFKKAGDHRIIVATFSSNIHRIQQIIDEAVRCDRRVAVSGRSMINVVNVATELGYLKVPDGVIIELDAIKNYTPDKLVIITTGSQGEPMSALYRMAFSDHRTVEIIPGDMIIISATPIPGNEKLVGRVVNELMKRGANVVYEKMYDVHVSGHACQEELKIMLSLTKPKYYFPVHGEQKHLVKNAKLGEAMGIPKSNIITASIGNVVEFGHNYAKIVDTVHAGRVLVDGLGVGDVGSIVLRDRKHLSEDGVIVVVMTLDESTGEILAGPEIISRGFVYVKESEQIMDEATEAACDALEQCYIKNVRDMNTVKTKVRDAVSKCLYGKTRRSPMILPIVMYV